MDFARSGMLGVVVICIALAGALFGAYLAGIDTEEREYTAYEYLADMSGEFEYDQSPQYIEFDPNTNYIGYYSTDTGIYFPDDNVDYKRYDGVNNYRVNTEPEVLGSGTVEIEDSTSSGGPWVGNDALYYKYTDLPDTVMGSPTRHAVRMDLSEFISEYITLSGTASRVKIASIEGQAPSEPTASFNFFDWIVFTSESEWTRNAGDTVNQVNVCSPQYLAQNPGTNLKLACLSAEIDLREQTVKRYSDNNFTDYVDTIYLNKCDVIFGGEGRYGTAVSIQLGNTFTYTEYQIVNYYMDPTKGVALKD